MTFDDIKWEETNSLVEEKARFFRPRHCVDIFYQKNSNLSTNLPFLIRLERKLVLVRASRKRGFMPLLGPILRRYLGS